MVDRTEPRAYAALTLASFLLVVLTGCARWSKEQGVENLWRAEGGPAFEEGVTTQKQVMEQLGPPSQIIGLEREVIFYYVREQAQGRGLILFVFNHIKQDISYDRAVFFFDEEGVLTSFSLSAEQMPLETGE